MGLSDKDVAEIYRRHAGVVYRRCLQMLGNKQDALEAVQDVFVKVLTKRETFRGQCDPTTWIYRITTNHALNQLRKKKHPCDPVESLPVSLHPKDEGFAGKLVTRDLLNGILKKLNERNKAILFLHFVEGLDQGEVAFTLGISRRAVVKRLGKIHEKLRSFLDEPSAAKQGERS